MTRSFACSLAAFALPVLLIGAVACSSSSNNNNSATKTTNTASSAGGSAAVVTPSAQVGGTPGAAPAIVEVATDTQYSVTKMAAPAGQPLTVTVQNKGAIHNWHLVGVKDAAGKDIATPLQQGPNTFSVTFTITMPGTYNFMCDADPVAMKGTLTIQ
jgi:plastocyanin